MKCFFVQILNCVRVPKETESFRIYPSIGRILCINRANTYTPNTEKPSNLCHAKTLTQEANGNAHTSTLHTFTASTTLSCSILPFFVFFLFPFLVIYTFSTYVSSELIMENNHIHHIPIKSRKLFNAN